MISVNDDGSICFEECEFNHRLVLNIAKETDEWRPVGLRQVDQRHFEGALDDAQVKLTLEKTGDHWEYSLTGNSETPMRIQLALELPDATDPYPIIPAVLFGDNNLDNVDERAFPHLTTEFSDEPNCSPYWECRADRASHPLALTAFDGGVVAVSIDPYCDNASGIEPSSRTDFVRNGLFAETVHGDRPQACGVTFGYRNTPCTYMCKTNFSSSTEHRFQSGEISGTLHLRTADDRRAVHSIIRDVHQRYRDPANTVLSDEEGIELLTHGMTDVGWIEEGSNWADLEWDFENEELVTFRGTNDEIAWTGGTESALPLLISGHRSGNEDAVEKALMVLDHIAAPESINPDSGWLWDVCSRTEGRSVFGWWAGAVGEAHCSYTNGEAVAYLLEAYRFARDEMDLERPNWRETPLKVLDTALSVQTPEGNFGYAYSTEDGSMIDPDGFAGCWFVPALALAHELTDESRYLEAAEKGISYYHDYVRRLSCWGTPMDTRKAIDQEGVLAFIRGARILHQITGEARYLTMLEDGAEYEYLWRFAIRSRPQEPPLKDSTWNSCGGSITSTSNPHIHPMGILVSGDLKYLAEQTGDPYHSRRMREGLDWALNSLELYPDQSDYGCEGILTERFCPSDGLLIEEYPDGSPASVWFTYHVWGAANVLEGLLKAGEVEG